MDAGEGRIVCGGFSEGGDLDLEDLDEGFEVGGMGGVLDEDQELEVGVGAHFFSSTGAHGADVVATRGWSDEGEGVF